MIPREELLQVRRLASRANPRVKEWAGLGDRAERDRLGLTLAEGAKLAEESVKAARAGLYQPQALLISDAGAEREEAGELFRKAGEAGIERYSLSDECFEKISQQKGADGLAMVLSFTLDVFSLPMLFTHPDARWVVAAGVQDPGNAGALARIALAAGATGCLFLDGADPHSPKFLRGGMGATFRMPCHSLATEDFVAGWQSLGVRLLAATPELGVDDFRDVDYSPPLGILVGGERGLPESLLALADSAARIPLRGGVESLNLAVAAGVILFEAENKWRSLGF